ncbi:hypothetical protein LCGC14_2633910 [marine sediment metagenome]|uniref:Uncharacterized protein n=1 Tax=marine sediment metagenome TaxID=412755 RepID=A0A0F8ZZA8_9ZZZZ
MAEWRPRDWKNKYLNTDGTWNFAIDTIDIAYEAGADAILAAIWKMAGDSPTGTFTFDTRRQHLLAWEESSTIIPTGHNG